MTSVRCVGDFSALCPRQVSTPREPLARLALIGTLVGSPSNGWGWPGYRSGSSPLPGGPLPWTAVKLLASLVPCSVAKRQSCYPGCLEVTFTLQYNECELNQCDVWSKQSLQNGWHLLLNFLLKASNLGQDTCFLTQQLVRARQKIR